MAEGSNTGTGGINIDGKIYSFDVGVSDENGGSQGAWSAGDVRVDEAPKDISKPTKETFAKYLSNSTLGKTDEARSYRPNSYPVGLGDATRIQDLGLRDELGNPIRPALTPNENKFSPEFNGSMGAPPPLQMTKGSVVATSEQSIPDGHNLLRNAAVPAAPDARAGYVKSAGPLNEPIGSYVSAVLKNNRFNPTGTNRGFIPDFLQASSPSDLSTDVLESNAAIADPSKLKFGTSPGSDDSLKREYGFKRLAKIAPALQMASTLGRSASDSSSTSPENKRDQSQFGPSATFPLSLPIERLNIENIARDLANDSSFTQPLSLGTSFESTLNNVVDRFSGFTSTATVALATALVKVVFDSFSRFISTNPSLEKGFLQAGKTGRYGGKGRQGIGTYFGNPGVKDSPVIPAKSSVPPPPGSPSAKDTVAAVFQRLGINPTSGEYKKSVVVGMNSFFYSINSAISYDTPAGGPAPKNANYALVIARAIIRAVSRWTLALNASANNPNRNQDIISEQIKILQDSRLIGIFNFFSQIGDIGLEANGDPANDVTLITSDFGDGGRKISTIDASADFSKDASRPAFYGKSRLFGGKVRKLAWSVNQLPDLAMRPPQNLLDMTSPLAGPSGLVLPDVNNPTAMTRLEMADPEQQAGTRLSSARASAIESAFDAEYMPFYFHDLRTNEIVGFHAFLSSLSEDFTANYESTEGFGRIEPVKSYKSTQRKISMSFIVAALDPADFNTMWYKINKLTTLLYPQYTPGKKLIAGDDYTFTKPFTQAIGASPMIRLRLGNLFRSNYSKFNLAGIFGLHHEDVVLDKMPRSIEAVKAKLEKTRDEKIAQAKRDYDEAIGKAKNERKNVSLYRSEFEFLAGARDFNHLIQKQPEVANKVGGSKNAPLAGQGGNSASAISSEAAAAQSQSYTTDPDHRHDIDGLKYTLIAKIVGILDAADGNNPALPPNTNKKEKTAVEIGTKPAPPDPQKNYSPTAIAIVELRQVTFDEYRFIQNGVAQKTGVDPGDEFMKGIKLAYDYSVKQLKAFTKAHPSLNNLVGQLYAISISDLQLTPDSLTEASLTRYKQLEAAENHKADEIINAAIKAATGTLTNATAAAQEEYEKKLNELSPDSHKLEFNKKIQNFMSEKNNVIVRSFNSTGGKGLAGFIESMAFDWMASTWDVSPGIKAPKMCKVTISFSPVHDISPGLDSTGYNRAPIYPLGPYKS